MTQPSGIRSKRAGIPTLFLAAAIFVLASKAISAALPVDLGTAGNFTALSKAGISATGTTFIVGNIGVAPIAASAITGFGLAADASNQFSTSSLVNGRVYAANYAPPTPAIMVTAIGDMETAYNDAAGRAPNLPTERFSGFLGGQTLPAGVYKWSTNVDVTGDLTLTGGANEIWIFEIAQDLTLATGGRVLLVGGAQPKNVFWQVAGQTTLNSGSVLNGNVLCLTAIILDTTSTLNGKALAQTAITFSSATANSVAGGYSGPNPPSKGQSFAYPSPARKGLVNFVYEMSKPGEVLIKVWNENGDLVGSIQEQKLAGPQKGQMSVSKFAPGVYLYKIAMFYDDGSKEAVAVQKFSVAK